MWLVYFQTITEKIELVMQMKDALKVAAITIVGLFIAVIFYPILHEGGHSLAAVIAGAEVKEFNLFPLPNVLCDVQAVTIPGLILIGLNGMILPFLIVSVVQPRKFWSWYVCFILRGICLLSFGISLIAIILYWSGTQMANEDIMQVIGFAPSFSILYALGLAGLIVWDIVLVVKSKPIRQCLEFFNLAQPKSE